MKSDTATLFCKSCFRRIEMDSLHALLSSHPVLCHRCYEELDPVFERFEVEGCKALAIYPYHQAFQSLLYQYKGCGDIELAPVFLERVYWYLKIRFFSYVIVPVPSSPGHDEARGFNQVIEACRPLGLPILPSIKKPFESKQSDLSKKERENVGNLLRFDKRYPVAGKRILLVDDVFTTGSTCRACIRILKAKGAKKIAVILLSKVPPSGKDEKG